MKITKIYIENFGKFSDFSLDFSGGLNCIKEDNGWGKSTIAGFIRVMFFGFENEGKRNGSSERERFRPWNGDAYGGYVEFEHQGKSYRIARAFKARESGDSFTLTDLDTMLDSRDYSSKIGEEIFGINSAGFIHTVFMGQEDIDSTVDDTVKAKLGGLGGLSDDMNRFDEVDAALKKMSNAIGGSGSGAGLKVCKNTITELEMALKPQAAVEQAIDEINAHLIEKKKELMQLKSQTAALCEVQKKAARAQGLKEKKNRYDSLVFDKDMRQKKLDQCAAVFSGSVPSETELAEKASRAAELRSWENRLERLRLSPEQQAFMYKYAPVYAGGIPSAEALSQVRDEMRALSSMEREYASLQFSQEEQLDFDIYSEKFKGRGDVADQADQAISCWTALSQKRAEMPGLEKELASKRTQLEKRKKEKHGVSSPVLIICAAALSLSGLGIFLIRSSVIGLIVLALGIVLAASGLVSARKGKAVKAEIGALAKEAAELEAVIENERSFINSQLSAVTAFVLSMELPSDEASIPNSLYSIKSAYGRYTQLLAKEQDQRNDQLAEKMEAARARIKAFLLPYSQVWTGASEDGDKLELIRGNVEKYRVCRAQKLEFEQENSRIAAAKEPLAAYVRSLGFYGGEGDLSEIIAQIGEALRRYKDARAEFKKADAAVSLFESENQMAEVLAAGSDMGLPSLDQISYRLEGLAAEQEEALELIRMYNASLDDNLQRRDELAEAARRLEAERERMAELDKKLTLINKTKELMKTAHTNMTNKYRMPIEEGFRKYYRLLDGGDGTSCVVDAHMELKVEEQGKPRSPQLYSMGIQDKVNLCMRMGVIDAMYKDDKPFVIMDDPFTNLDDDRLAGALDMVRKLAEDRQIIYLTCHESRSVKA